MIDPFVILAPVLLLGIVALLRFVGCSFTPGSAGSTTPGPITYVQGGAQDATHGEREEIANTDNVSTYPFAMDVTPGNLIVVWIKYNYDINNPAQVMGVTDSAVPSNQYYRAGNQTTGLGSLTGWRQEIWYATIDQAGPNLTVTAKFTGAFNGKKAISPHEYKGADPTYPWEGASGKAGVTANPATDAATDAVMTTAARLVFGAAVIQNMGSSGPGFSQRSSQDGDVAEDMPITSPVSVSATFLVVSPPGMSQDWIAQVATFK